MRTDGTVSIVDVASKKVTETLAADVGGANRLKFTPDGARALVTTLSGTDLVVLDTATHKTVKRITSATAPPASKFRPTGGAPTPRVRPTTMSR